MTLNTERISDTRNPYTMALGVITIVGLALGIGLIGMGLLTQHILSSTLGIYLGATGAVVGLFWLSVNAIIWSKK